MAKSKRKAVHYELILEHEGKGKSAPRSEPYRLLDQSRGQWHEDLADARIALAWRKQVKADKDGKLVLGKVRKASDLDRELAPYDFVVLLNQEAWDELTEAQRLALLDHELCHVVPVLDDNGKPQLNERGHPCFRLRKHDLEEFRAVVERHGCYLSDVAEFAQSLRRAKDAPLFAGVDNPAVAGSVG